MAKGKKQTADDLLRRYSAETVNLDAGVAPPPAPIKKTNPLLESVRRNLNRVVLLPLEMLVIEENVRRQVDETAPEFASLVDSIRAGGIRQNLIVELQDEDEEHFKLVVVAGQRRLLAGKRAGVKQVAALVLRLPGRGARLIEGLAENLLREDLHCLDQAEAYAALLAEGWTQDELAEKFERRRRTILQFLRLARYPEKARELIRAHREVFTTNLLFNKFVAKNWPSEDELLRALRAVLNGKKSSAKPPAKMTASLNRLVKSVNRYNGLNCKVSGHDEAGKLTISYKSKTALAKIIALFEND